MTDAPTKADIAVSTAAAASLIIAFTATIGAFPYEVSVIAFVLYATLWWFAAGWLVDLYNAYWLSKLNRERTTNETIAND